MQELRLVVAERGKTKFRSILLALDSLLAFGKGLRRGKARNRIALIGIWVSPRIRAGLFGRLGSVRRDFIDVAKVGIRNGR